MDRVRAASIVGRDQRPEVVKAFDDTTNLIWQERTDLCGFVAMLQDELKTMLQVAPAAWTKASSFSNLKTGIRALLRSPEARAQLGEDKVKEVVQHLKQRWNAMVDDEIGRRAFHGHGAVSVAEDAESNSGEGSDDETEVPVQSPDTECASNDGSEMDGIEDGDGDGVYGVSDSALREELRRLRHDFACCERELARVRRAHEKLQSEAGFAMRLFREYVESGDDAVRRARCLGEMVSRLLPM